MNIHDQDAADAAAAWEAMNEQTADLQAFLRKRPTPQEMMAKAKATGYFDPYAKQDKRR